MRSIFTLALALALALVCTATADAQIFARRTTVTASSCANGSCGSPSVSGGCANGQCGCGSAYVAVNTQGQVFSAGTVLQMLSGRWMRFDGIGWQYTEAPAEVVPAKK